MQRVLIVEDDLNLQRVLQAQVERMGYRVSVAEAVPRALEVLAADAHDLVLTDLSLPGSSGLDLLKTVRADYPETAVILMTAFGTVSTAVEAMRAGAYDYLTKPLHMYELRTVIDRALERRRLIEEIRVLRFSLDRKYGFESIIGSSPTLLQVLEAAAYVASTDATILIRGETGTGKELLAKAIHLNSPRRERPFVVINCGAIPKDLLESELFGHVRGAFTGAFTHKKGKVEAAEGGSVFLDEIGEMPLDMQVRILRLVQEHEIEKVGAFQRVKVDVRILAATHRNLEELVARGDFREDLYYRLSVVPLRLPPLRDRMDDIPEFVERFFEESKHKHNKDFLTLPASLMWQFQRHTWPGNVRELENTISRIVLLARGREITVADLEQSLPVAIQQAPAAKIPASDESLDSVERAAILNSLRKFGGNQSRAARHLQITRKILTNRIAKYGIGKEEIGVRTAGHS